MLWLENISDLSDITTYKNGKVIEYFCHFHPEITFQEAEQLFADLIAWLWLNAHRQKAKRHTYLFGPLLILDELWHAFILHTQEYFDFCVHYFGAYFHHNIESIGKEHEIMPDELADFLDDAVEYLGTAWVLRYFPIN